MGVTIGGDYSKIGKNTHLLVIMRMRLSQKIGQIDLKIWTGFKKGNSYKIRTKIVPDYCGISLMLYVLYIYYDHTNVDLLEQ